MTEPNITCPRCRHRHPASRTCTEAKRLADEAAAQRHADRLAETAPEVVTSKDVSTEKIDSLLDELNGFDVRDGYHLELAHGAVRRWLAGLHVETPAERSPLEASDAFVAKFGREPMTASDSAWMNGFAVGKRSAVKAPDVEETEVCRHMYVPVSSGNSDCAACGKPKRDCSALKAT